MKICDDVNLITVEPKNFQRLNNRTVVMANRSRTYSNCLFIFLFFCQKFDSVRSNWTSTHKTIMGSVRSNTYKKKKKNPVKIRINSVRFAVKKVNWPDWLRFGSVKLCVSNRNRTENVGKDRPNEFRMNYSIRLNRNLITSLCLHWNPSNLMAAVNSRVSLYKL